MDRIRVGMVGVSNFGACRRVLLRDTEMFTIVACFDYSNEALEAAQAEEGCVVVASYDELLAQDIEAIVISTGADSHADYAIRAAQAGKHFFVEKPLCTNMDELTALLTAGEKAGVVMGMGHSDLDTPIDAIVSDYLASGRLGTIVAVEITTCHGGGWYPSAWRFDPAKNPGGMLFQCGVHSLHWLQTVFGSVREVSAMMRYDMNPNTKTSDATTVLLRLDSGLLATLHAYHVTAYHHFRFIYGTRGNLYIYEYPEAVFFQERSETGHEEKVSVPLPPAQTISSRMNMISWAKAIRGEGTPAPSIYDGARAVAAVFAAAESAVTRCVVTIPESIIAPK